MLVVAWCFGVSIREEPEREDEEQSEGLVNRKELANLQLGKNSSSPTLQFVLHGE